MATALAAPLRVARTLSPPPHAGHPGRDGPPAIAVTQPDAGSDVAGTPHLCCVRDGRRVGHQRLEALHHERQPQADWPCLFAPTTDHEDGYRGMSQIVVPPALPGFTVSSKLDKLGQPVERHRRSSCSFVDLRVPVAEHPRWVRPGLPAVMAQFQNGAHDRRVHVDRRLLLSGPSSTLKQRQAFGHPLSLIPSTSFPPRPSLVAEIEVSFPSHNHTRAEAYLRGEDTTRHATIAKPTSRPAQPQGSDTCIQFHFLSATWRNLHCPVLQGALLSIGGRATRSCCCSPSSRASAGPDRLALGRPDSRACPGALAAAASGLFTAPAIMAGEGLRLGRPALGVALGEPSLVHLVGAVRNGAVQLPVEHEDLADGLVARRFLDRPAGAGRRPRRPGRAGRAACPAGRAGSGGPR